LSELSPPDSRLARRRFNRAGPTYAAASRLEAEVASRMLERLDYVKVAPARILDGGSGPARDAPALARRYRGARIFALDSAIAMLPKAGWMERLVGRKAISVCGVLERLPFADASFELAWSNMALHWAADPLAALRELERVLAPEGLLMFSTLGPDTLKELRAAAGATRVHEFIDMHDVGDMLVAAGFAAPVMDMEMLRIDYASGERLLEDLRASGQTNARPDRPRGLAGRAFLAEFRGRKVSASYEVVYGHAWKRERAAAEPATAKSIRIFKRIP
jgi:malonyl-CoA O-methyltransferase